MRALIASLLGLCLVMLCPFQIASHALLVERAARDSPRSLGLPLRWPADLSAADPATAEAIIVHAAERAQLNVFRTGYGSDASGRTTITHWVYLATEETALFDAFALVHGRWPTVSETRHGSFRVSTDARSDSLRIGTPRVFADAFELAFAPLHAAFDTVPATGTYTVETQDPESHQQFLRWVRDDLERIGVTHLTLGDLGRDDPSPALASTPWPRVLPVIIGAITSVLALALILRNAKSCGVRALLGHSAMRIWIDIGGRLISAVAALALISTALIAGLVPNTNAIFIGNTVGVNFAIAGVTLIVSLGTSLLLTQCTSVVDLVNGGLR